MIAPPIAKAQDPKAGMTLGELGEFVQECLRRDVDPASSVKIVTGFRSQIQELSIRQKG